MQRSIMKIDQHDDGSSVWRVACDCGEPNHDAQLYFEPIDEDHTDISMMLEMEIGFYGRWGFWDNLKRRVSAATRILFTGYYTMRGDVILDEDGMKAMRVALDNGEAHARKAKASWDKKSND